MHNDDNANVNANAAVDANTGLDESLALAKQLEDEEHEANRQVQMLENQIENEGQHPAGETIS